MKNKIALEEHFSIEGMTFKNDVMDAPTFAEVRSRLADKGIVARGRGQGESPTPYTVT